MHYHRLFAALNSLTDRADLFILLDKIDDPVACSQYGDTDTIIHIRVGDTDEVSPEAASTSRHALCAGRLILHTTQGGRAVWRLDATLTTWSRRNGQKDEILLRHPIESLEDVQYSDVLYGDGTQATEVNVRQDLDRAGQRLLGRILSELAASSIRVCTPVLGASQGAARQTPRWSSLDDPPSLLSV